MVNRSAWTRGGTAPIITRSQIPGEAFTNHAGRASGAAAPSVREGNLRGHAPWATTATWNERTSWQRRSDERPSGPRRWGFACELLAAYRADAGMTNRDLARASGLPRATVSGIERGYQQPNEAQVRALADALGVDDWALCWA